MKLTMTQRGIITVIGGFFLEIVTGTALLWGSMNVYVTSYFRSKDDPDLKLSLGGVIFPLMMISMAIGIPIGMKEIKWFGSARISCMVSGIIAAGTVFAASFCTKFWQFIIVYGVIHGMAQGTAYFIPVYMGYLYFPKNRGLIAGIVTGGFALCAFTFGLIFFSIVNPTGLQQVKNNDGFSYFDGPSIEVAGNVPSSLRYLSLFFILISVFSSCLILHHPQQVGEEEKRLKEQLKENEKLKQTLKEDIAVIQNAIQEKPSNKKTIKELTPTSNQIQNIQNGVTNTRQVQEEVLMVNETMSLHVLAHTLEVVELQEKVLQRKLEVTHQEDEQANSLAILFGREIQNTNLAALDSNINSEIPQRKSINFQQLIHPRDTAIPSIFVHVSDEILDVNKLPHKNTFIEQDQMEEILRQENQFVQQELEAVTKKKQQINELNKMGAPSVSAALKRPELYVSIILGILSIGFGMLVNGNFKSIAKDYGYRSDSFQVILGSVGGIANGFCRPIWASLLDKFTFKQILTAILCLEIIFSLTMRFTKTNEVFLVFWVFLDHMCFGAILAIWPVLSAQLNGVKIGAQLFGLYWFGFGVATLIQFGIVLFWKNALEFDNIYYLYTGQTIIALIIIRFYDFHIPWDKYYLKIEEKKIQDNNQNRVLNEQKGYLQIELETKQTEVPIISLPSDEMKNSQQHEEHKQQQQVTFNSREVIIQIPSEQVA